MSTNPDQNERIFDEYATSYGATVDASIKASGETVEYFAELKARLVAEHLRASGRQPRKLLDFGCGTGLSTRTLGVALPPDTRLTGLDVSGESISRARDADATTNRTYVHHADGNLPFPSATFDVVFSACVFHHIERSAHARWFFEIRRVLKPDGIFYLFEHNPYNPLTVRAVKACPFDDGVILLTPRYARRAIESAGFRHLSVRYYFFFPKMLESLRVLEPKFGQVPLGAQYFIAAQP